MWTWERSLKLNRIFGGQGLRQAKSAELRVCLGKDKWPASQFREQRMLLLFLQAEIGAVNLLAEETTLGSSWVQPNAIQANAWLELFLDHLYFCFLPTPFSFPSTYHCFLKIIWVGETLLVSFELMPFSTVCYQALFFLHFHKQKKIHVETGNLFSAVFRKLVFCSI